MPDVIIIGGGAAGLFCAIEAGRRGRSVLVLERNPNIGQKIRISGGGRCNFTNRNVSHENFLSSNPHFCKSALARFTPADFIARIECHRIPYHEREHGQLFCNRSSVQIVEMLRRECSDAGVRIATDSRVHEVCKGEAFAVTTGKGEYRSDSLVIATGGLSIPKMGATDFGLRIARRFGLKIVETKPGLVPLTFARNETALCSELSGVSVDAIVRCGNQLFRENILFTHRGLSGPAILQISSYWRPGDHLSVDLAPDRDLRLLLADESWMDATVCTFLSDLLPRRLAKKLCDQHGWTGRLREYPLSKRLEIAERVHSWNLKPEGTEGFSKAEVTCGGIDTRELSSKTMQSNTVPGLYAIGEVIDVTGHLGGYNFQWAWSSGFAAGQTV